MSRCSVCKVVPLVVKIIRGTALGLCPDCDVRICHWGATAGNPSLGVMGRPGCTQRVPNPFTRTCPSGHPL